MDENARKTVYEGEVRKCPNCGAVISAMQAICPDCGFEMTERKSSNTVKEFANEIRRLQDELTNVLRNSSDTSVKDSIIEAQYRKIALYISTFPIPNTVEDISELMLLASQNIQLMSAHSLNSINGENHMLDAWRSMMEMCYSKAKISFAGSTQFSKIEELYISRHRLSKGISGWWKIILGLIVVVIIVLFFRWFNEEVFSWMITDDQVKFIITIISIVCVTVLISLWIKKRK